MKLPLIVVAAAAVVVAETTAAVVTAVEAVAAVDVGAAGSCKEHVINLNILNAKGC